MFGVGVVTRRVALVSAALCLTAGGVLATLGRRVGIEDWLRPIEVAALLATGCIVLWYTEETAKLRETTDRQVTLAVRPAFAARLVDAVLYLSNHGAGMARDVRVRVLEVPAWTGIEKDLERWVEFGFPGISPNGSDNRPLKARDRASDGFVSQNVWLALCAIPDSRLRVEIRCTDALSTMHTVEATFTASAHEAVIVEATP